MSITQRGTRVHTSSVEELNRALQFELHLLQQRCRQGVHYHELFESVFTRLQCLPLSTEEYGRATCHLKNAFRYMCSGESGAALYELRLLL